ncbi:profilin-3 [Lepisosteus oculatus]|uniref:Profilin n=1 Tax=Lepisosteus oculatus TaxID=7918 RepID=W5NP47_LEPOC|nr:PREDICTED: profilin-3 [Lepisosteus oculatus]XP_015205255.1 PREDICTED: profilin-3 [Lepisosteus oculatus]XP_015205256.1 PREDICTED: profilin-3 [Lepisosteus oculatus]
MGEWKDYVAALLKEETVEDAAVVGCSESKAVWASRPGGVLAAVSPQEVEILMGNDRTSFLRTGITIGGKKASVIRDYLMIDEDSAMDIRTKGDEGKSIAVGRTAKALVFLIGKRGVHGGLLNKKVHDIVKYLKERGI